MFDRILVPLDGSPLAEQALPYARYIATAFALPIRVLACAPGDPLKPTGAGNLHGLVGKYLERMCEPLRAAGLQASTLLSGDDAAMAIVDEADRQPGALVVMSSHGRTGMQRWTLGSVTERVLQASRSDMLIVRRGTDPASAGLGISTVVVPLDGSALAEQALVAATGLARAAGLHLRLLRIMSPETSGYLQGDSFGGAWRDIAEDREANVEDYMRAVTARLGREGVTHVDYRLLEGEPAERIVDVARETPDCIVAMTTHGRSGIGRWVLGSVATRVVRHCPRPVLLLRARVPRAREGSG